MYFFTLSVIIRFCIAFFLRFLRFLFLDSLSASLGLATDCSEMTLLYFSTCFMFITTTTRRSAEIKPSLKSEVRSPKSEVQCPSSAFVYLYCTKQCWIINDNIY